MKVKNEKLEKLCRAMQMQRRTADSKRHNEVSVSDGIGLSIIGPGFLKCVLWL